MDLRDRALTIILIIIVIGTLGLLGYIMLGSRAGEKFTEFYILGLEGEATGYPTDLSVGEEGSVTVGIINQERQTANYWLEIRIDSVSNNEVGPLELEHNQKWEEIVSFTPDSVGDGQKVEFLLYKDGESEPYHNLHLWVNVKE